MVLCLGLFPNSLEENLNSEEGHRSWITTKVRAASAGENLTMSF